MRRRAYVNTMSAKELWAYFLETEKYSLKPGKVLEGYFYKIGSVNLDILRNDDTIT